MQINNVSMSQINNQILLIFPVICSENRQLNRTPVFVVGKMSRSSYSQKLSSLKAAAMAKIAGVASADDNDDDDIPPPPPPEDTKFENDFLFFFRCVNFHMSF